MTSLVKKGSACFGMMGVLAVFSWANPAQAADPTFSIKVVEQNGWDVPSAPVGTFDADPLDVLTVELFLRDWSPNGEKLRLYQTQIDSSGYTSGTMGDIFPVDWATTTDLYFRCSTGGPDGEDNGENAYVDSVICPPYFEGDGDPQGSDIGWWSDVGDLRCDDMGCGPGGICENPSIDWVFGLSSTGIVSDDTTTQTNTIICDYRHIGSVDDSTDSVLSPQDGTEFYLGTVKLLVSEFAAGTFTLCLDQTDDDPEFSGPDYSFLKDENGDPILPILFDPCLTINVGDGCTTDEECEIGECTIDRCVASTCESTPRLYGDINLDGVVDLFGDVLCVFNISIGALDACTPGTAEEADIEPCGGNEIVDLFGDVLAVFNASVGAPDPCCGG